MQSRKEVPLGNQFNAALKFWGLTQKDLADHLGKTAAAISDLERGKVQVTASDLFQIAQLLNKPIEYFYGEEYSGSDIQDLAAIMRKQSSIERSNSIELTKMMVRMQELGDDMQSLPTDKEVPLDKIKEFYNLFVPFSVAINGMAKQLNDLREKFDEELKIRGIELSE